MPTPRQLQLIHVAKRQVFGPDDDRSYRMLLSNVAAVATAKDLTNKTFEDVMAVLEDMGFADTAPGHGPRYWRKKADGSGSRDRMAHKIKEAAADQRYELAALCLRFSAHRTNDPEQLHPREAWNLIEMLKEVAAREAHADAAPAPF